MIRSLPTLATLASTLAFAVPLATQMPEERGGHAEQLGRVRFTTTCGGAARRGGEHRGAPPHSLLDEKAAEAFTAAAPAGSGRGLAVLGGAVGLVAPPWGP